MRRIAALALVSAAAFTAAPAQDSVAARPSFAIDSLRAVPFRNHYQMLAVIGDSSQIIGSRTVEMTVAAYAEAPAWLIVERRTGAVAAVESLYVSPDMRPLRWSAAVGPATLAMVFARDSVFGATSGPGGRQSVLAPSAAKTIISIAMLDAMLPVLPLSERFTDSVSVFFVTQSGATAASAELAVVGTDEGTGDWILALRAPAQTLILWVDRASGHVVRSQQPLPLHTASLLEYRRTKPTPP